MENAELGTINIVPGVQVQAPIAVELLLAVGIGGVFAWIFSIWTQLQRQILSSQQVRQKNVQIRELETKVKQYQTEIQSMQPVLPPAGDA
ncbi:LapA family protein [Fortiea contorta]|uniref:LapA family protein n=1 Tax=Fortiea contorta TaxID=1892405 RepID=UPI00034CC25C|nr:LapA family protein [Fortiea contorta]